MTLLTMFIIMPIIFFPVSTIAGQTDTAAQSIVEVFDGLCVQNYDDYSNIDHMVKLMDGKKIPKSLQDTDPAMRKQGGNSYSITYESKKYTVGYVNGGGCSIGTMNMPHKELSKLIMNNYIATLEHTEPAGGQVTKIYQIHGPSFHKNALIYLMHARAEAEHPVGSISFLPSKVVKRFPKE